MLSGNKHELTIRWNAGPRPPQISRFYVPGQSFGAQLARIFHAIEVQRDVMNIMCTVPVAK